MAKRIDLVGKIFGHWKVQYPVAGGYWHCLCDCGVEKDVLSSSLRSGKSTSCGHVNKVPQHESLEGKQIGEWSVGKYCGDGKYECTCSCGVRKLVSSYTLINGESKSCGHNTTGFKDLYGKKFGDWTVLEYSGNQQWKCECVCGTVRNVATTSLVRNLSTNCGCKHKVSLEGRQIGELTVIERSDTDNNFWVCKCSCGNIKEIRESALVNGITKSCGCKTVEFKRKTMAERYGEIAVSRINNPRSEYLQKACIQADTLRELLVYESNIKGDMLTLSEVAKILDISQSKASIHLKEFGLNSMVKYGVFGEEENELLLFIKSFGYDVEQHNKDIIKPYELDIYIPELMIAFEFNGTYWHKEDYKGKTYHQDKTLRCIHKHIRLIHIFEYEWINNRSKIEAYISNILSKNNPRIYARNTIIKEICWEDTAKFLDENHLQGRATSSVNIALHHNNEIISVMTFGRPRFGARYQYELIRLAHKGSTIVVGGTQKMFNYFIKRYNPESIQSYCDAAKFIGDVYFKLDFKLDDPFISEPNYVWVDKYNEHVYKRYQTQKHKLLKAELGEFGNTEVEIMENLGYVRVFDSGNYRFVWKKD